MFKWLNLGDRETQLIDFKSSTIYKQKFVLLKGEFKKIERDEAFSNLVKHLDSDILKMWNTILENYSTLKEVSMVSVSIFSSIYSYVTLLRN